MTSLPLPARRTSMTPAQRVILLLGVPATLALVAWTGYSIVASTAQGSYTSGYTAPITGRALTMNLDGGDVDVQGGAATGSARLTQIVSYGLTRPDVQPALSVSHGAAGTSISFASYSYSDNFAISGAAGVPARTAVTVSTNGGNATIGGIAAPASASTNGGNVTVSGLTDGGMLSSGGGDITATGVTGGTTMLTGGGSVYADQVSGNLEMSTQGGNVQATGLATPDLSVDSGGGYVTLTLTTAPKNLQVDTEGGSVTLILPPGSGPYDVKVNATSANAPNGTVSDTVTSSPSAKNLITVNSGGGDVTIS
ncbi:MAG TPA: DUF4097 family beta strand repeat-containing protein [Trebonia sp.]|jgi:hypothetical protein|nr:DUF4097 family beta strand repeat-containing protein [Trebonia sp.]